MLRIAARCRAVSSAVFVLFAAFFALSVGTARAGTYEVSSCTPDGSAAGWNGYGSTSVAQRGILCPTRGDLNGRGMTVVNAAGVGLLNAGSGGLKFTAPAGTNLVGLSANVRVQRSDRAYWVGLMSGGAMLAGWWANEGPTAYTEADFPSTGWFNLNHAGEVHLEVGCSAVCDTAKIGPIGYRAWAQLTDPVTIRIEDTVAPAETLTGGSLLTGTYATGTQTVEFSATDVTGIRVTRLYIDGSKVREDSRTCNFEQPVPCSNVSAGSYSVDTRELSDGPHVVKIESVDAAGNATSQSRTITVDNGAPTAPVVSVTDGESWRSSNDFAVSWTNSAAQGAPIVKAHYQVCRADQPADCEPAGVDASSGVSSLSGIRLPHDGDYTLRVWLEDAAGNTSVDNASEAVHLRYDATAPEQVRNLAVTGGEGWRARNSFDLTWDEPDTQLAPVAAVHYRLCEVGGACATAAQSGSIHLDDIAVPTAGDYTLSVWLEDAAGNVNEASASSPVHLRLDDSDPGLAQPSAPSGWLNTAGYDEVVGLATGGAVPPSGIAGYAVTVDGSDPESVSNAGPDGVFHIAELPEGTVTVRARAISGAGVASKQVGEVTLHVDRTPPTTSASGAPESWDRGSVHLNLGATDQLSGMADGHIAYSVDGGQEVVVDGGTAAVEVGGNGRHEVRYYAVDAAGNRADARVVTFRIDGDKPGVAVPESSAGWINATGPYEERIALDPGELVPSSGLSGFSVTLDGSVPDDTPETGPDGKLLIGELSEGLTTVKARAISGSGVVSDAVGTGTIRVDRTPPTVVIDKPTGRALRAEVSDELSGLSGATFAVRRVGSTEWKALSSELRGGRLTAVVTSDSARVSYDVRATAVDAAGNRQVTTTLANGDEATITVDAPPRPAPAPVTPVAPVPARPAPATTAPSTPAKHGTPTRCVAKKKRPKRSHHRHRGRHRHQKARARTTRACKPAHPRGGEKHRHRHLGRKTHKPARKHAG